MGDAAIAGDAVSMSMNLGYLIGTGIFAVIFLAAVVVQIRAKAFHPLLYWTTIVATTTVGTTLADFADFADRSLGIGYAGGSSLLLALLLASLFIWHRTLGTALGDWTADTAGLGYTGAALIFGALLLAIVVAHYVSKVSPTLLFWAAFILTRPLGAVVGDFLDKPHAQGGMELSRYAASAALLGFMLVCLLCFRQRAARVAH